VNRLHRFLEWYLGLPSADPGQGTTWDLMAPDRHAGGIPGGLWTLAILGIAVVIWLYRRQGRNLSSRKLWTLTGLRLVSLLVLLLMASGISLAIRKTGLPYLVVLLDTSSSMGIVDQTRDTLIAETARKRVSDNQLVDASRLELAKSVLLDKKSQVLTSLKDRYRLKLFSFDDAVESIGAGDAAGLDEVSRSLRSIRPLGSETRPAPCLKQVLEEFRGSPPAGVVILTDGVASRSAGERLSQAAEDARTQSVPLFPVGLGSSDPDRDLELTDLLVERMAILGDPLLFTARVRSWGVDQEPVRATLRQVGEPRVLATTEIQPTTNPFSLELLTVPEDEGDLEYEVTIEPVRGESTLENNVARATVSVRSTQIRVLLVERSPRWEFRHLKPLLERDKMIELKTVLQESDIDFVQEDRTALPGFPARQVDLNEFDVVILGDIDLSLLNPQSLAHLKSFVSEQGGGLILVAGERHNPLSYRGTPLEALCPVLLSELSLPAPEVTESGFQLEPTPEGRSQAFLRLDDQSTDPALFWKTLPPLYWSVEPGQRKPGAVALAVQANRFGKDGKIPVLVWQRFGAGQVLFHATDELWQWRQGREDSVYGRYWGQAIRQLSRAKLLGDDRTLHLASDRPVYTLGETVKLLARAPGGLQDGKSAESMVAIVERPGGERRRVPMQKIGDEATEFEANWTSDLVGPYRAWIESAGPEAESDACRFRIEIPNRELRQRAADHNDLQEAARISRGQFYHWTKSAQLVRDLPAGRPITESKADYYPLWNRWELLLILLTCLTAEWIIRKRSWLV
jgi:uncharacterized membrane protein